jgi:tRNA threonylcarbamoyladenosine biosynthesis protein TsaB
VLAVIDARRGEVFAAAYADGRELTAPHALEPGNLQVEPGDLQAILAQPDSSPRAVGDGAVRYRDHLEAAGVRVPEDSSRLHEVSGEAICDISLGHAPEAIDVVLPDYLRRPDAEIALERKAASGSVGV